MHEVLQWILHQCLPPSLSYSLADHFGGKLHLGFVAIREKIAELEVSVYVLASVCALYSGGTDPCECVVHYVV